MESQVDEPFQTEEMCLLFRICTWHKIINKAILLYNNTLVLYTKLTVTQYQNWVKSYINNQFDDKILDLYHNWLINSCFYKLYRYIILPVKRFRLAHAHREHNLHSLGNILSNANNYFRSWNMGSTVDLQHGKL